MRAEILTDPEMGKMGATMLEAMIATAPVPITVTRVYEGRSDILMTYGMGHPVRRQWWTEHIRKGGRCIGWDLGYWGREHGAMRVTIDHDHPHSFIRPETPERWDSQGIPLRDESDPNGHALVVGIGLKSVRALGLGPMQWERDALSKARTLGLRGVLKKKDRKEIGPALKGAALVLCRHSNVAVDACIAGVPVMCEDGAALALYRNSENPTENERLQFLRSLAWWNWRPDEAGEAWNYLLSRLS